MSRVKEAQVRYKLTEVQINEWAPRIEAKYEPTYQREAFLNLVTLPFQAAKEEFGDRRIGPDTAELINHRIRERVWEWVDQRSHLGSDFTLNRFLWSVIPNPERTTMIPSVFPDVLRQLRQGNAPLRLFRPKYEELLRLISEELKLEPDRSS